MLASMKLRGLTMYVHPVADVRIDGTLATYRPY